MAESAAPSPGAVATKTKLLHFLPSTRRIVQFSEGREPKPGDRVVYLDGAFDLFNVGHVKAIARARSFGDYLIVGIYDDELVYEYKGEGFPVMNLHERVLSVLSCRYVDEVVIGCPWSMSKENIASLRITIVAAPSLYHPQHEPKGDPYAVRRRCA